MSQEWQRTEGRYAGRPTERGDVSALVHVLASTPALVHIRLSCNGMYSSYTKTLRPDRWPPRSAAVVRGAECPSPESKLARAHALGKSSWVLAGVLCFCLVDQLAIRHAGDNFACMLKTLPMLVLQRRVSYMSVIRKRKSNGVEATDGQTLQAAGFKEMIEPSRIRFAASVWRNSKEPGLDGADATRRDEATRTEHSIICTCIPRPAARQTRCLRLGRARVEKLSLQCCFFVVSQSCF